MRSVVVRVLEEGTNPIQPFLLVLTQDLLLFVYEIIICLISSLVVRKASSPLRLRTLDAAYLAFFAHIPIRDHTHADPLCFLRWNVERVCCGVTTISIGSQ